MLKTLLAAAILVSGSAYVGYHADEAGAYALKLREASQAYWYNPETVARNCLKVAESSDRCRAAMVDWVKRDGSKHVGRELVLMNPDTKNTPDFILNFGFGVAAMALDKAVAEYDATR